LVIGVPPRLAAEPARPCGTPSLRHSGGLGRPAFAIGKSSTRLGRRSIVNAASPVLARTRQPLSLARE
jgi:hypothetical protein